MVGLQSLPNFLKTDTSLKSEQWTKQYLGEEVSEDGLWDVG